MSATVMYTSSPLSVKHVRIEAERRERKRENEIEFRDENERSNEENKREKEGEREKEKEKERERERILGGRPGNPPITCSVMLMCGDSQLVGVIQFPAKRQLTKKSKEEKKED